MQNINKIQKFQKFLFQLKCQVDKKIRYSKYACFYFTLTRDHLMTKIEHMSHHDRHKKPLVYMINKFQPNILPWNNLISVNAECKYFLHTSSSNITLKQLADNIIKQPKEAPVRRIAVLAKLFDYSENEILGLLAKYKFLNHLSLHLIREKVKVMEDFELPKSFIKSNLRIMYHTSTFELQKRLQLLKNSNFLSPNPVLIIDKLGHYLECPNEVFHFAFLKLCAELQSLEGCTNQAEYVQKRLNITKNMAFLLVSSYPLNRGVSNAKLKEFFDFTLMEANLRPECVMQNMRLCSYSVTRLRDRMNVMKAASVTPDKWIKIWNLSENEFKLQFESFIE